MNLSHYDYIKSREAAADYPFYALVAAAMRRADTNNIELLKRAFPGIHKLLKERYHNSGGYSNAELKAKKEIEE